MVSTHAGAQWPVANRVLGTHIDRRRHTVTIQRFEGERKVRDLGLYPEVYANNYEQKRAHRVARGKKYFEYLSSPVPCLRYEGYLSDKATEAPDIESQSWVRTLSTKPSESKR